MCPLPVGATRRATALLLAAGLLGGCRVTHETDRADTAGSARATTTQPAAPGGSASPAAPPAAGAPAGVAQGPPATDSARPAADSAVDPNKVKPEDRPRADLRLEVDVAARRLHVLRGEARTASYPVGVGTAQWPTQPGEWVVSQVVWNPEWIPPRDESWTEDREPKKPGEPDNPLGQAQLIYDPPRTVHGTNQPQTVGRASSHGSIRMHNADITRLAREVMEVAGVGRDEAWYRQVQQNRTEKQVVDLPRVVPIRVR